MRDWLRRRVENRNLTFNWDRPAARGQVSPEQALRLAPVFAAGRLLASNVSQLPVQVYRKVGDRREPLPLPSLLASPSVQGTRLDWTFRAMTSLIYRGNAVGLIVSYSADGIATGVEWLHPDEVTVEDDQPHGPGSFRQPIWRWRGQTVSAGDLVHIPWFTLPGRVWGLSPLTAYANSVATALAAQDFSKEWFDSGGVPPGTFENANVTVNQEQADIISNRLVNSIRKHRPIVYGKDWKYTPVSVSPSEARFVETMRLTASQVANIYGIPPEMIGGETGKSMCVDTDTEMLTTRGWLRYNQIRVGDTCLTLNADTHVAEWQQVEAVHVFEGPHDMLRFRSRTHSSLSTLDHRWPVLRETRRGMVPDWRESQTMSASDRVLAAAPVSNLPTEPKWADAFVELVAWFWTEGWIGPHNEVRITQSHTVNVENCSRIRAVLADVFGPACQVKHVRSEPAWIEEVRPAGTTQFRLNKRAAARLLEVAAEKIPSIDFLVTLTRAQLELFVQISLDADGCVTNSGTPYIAQKDPRRLEAFQVACALAGRSGAIRPTAGDMWGMAVWKASHRKPKGHVEYVHQERIDGSVWCPTTPNRTWFARREGTTYFTGNTYANVEQQSIEFVQFTLMPWLTKLESHLSGLLPRGQYVKFNVDALIRPDAATRYANYKTARDIGLKNIDEIRAMEDLPPLPNGAGQDYTPLTLLEKGQAVPQLRGGEYGRPQLVDGRWKETSDGNG
ncbi:MAG: phage portal protein [Streptosporangiales bacterium]